MCLTCAFATNDIQASDSFDSIDEDAPDLKSHNYLRGRVLGNKKPKNLVCIDLGGQQNYHEFKFNMKAHWFVNHIDSVTKGPCPEPVKTLKKKLSHSHTWCKKFNKQYCDITAPEAATKWLKKKVKIVGKGKRSCAQEGIPTSLIGPPIKLKLYH